MRLRVAKRGLPRGQSSVAETRASGSAAGVTIFMVDENQAAHVPPDVAPLSYHCPNTACDGHFYLKTHELGQPQTCQKCGLATTIGWQKLPRASGGEEINRSRFRRQNWFIRAAQHPEFRIAILAGAIWLLLIQAYQPWQHYRGYKSSRLLEEATFFFWRIGFNAVLNGPIAVLVGVIVITVLAYIVGWVARSFSKISGLPGSPAPTGGRYPRQPRDGGLAAAEDLGTGVKQQGTTTGLDRFVQLSHSIRLNCWQEIHADDASREANNEVLKRAYREYKRQLQPWLSAMSDAYGPDAEVIAPARNAAARCLISLSGGFLCVNNLADAENLASEALSLAIDDDAVEAEIQGQLKDLRTERERSKPDFRRRQTHKSFWLRPAAIYLPLLGLVISVVVIVQLGDRVRPSAEPRVLPSFTQFERNQSTQANPLSAAPSPGTVSLGKITELQPATPPAPRGVTGAAAIELSGDSTDRPHDSKPVPYYEADSGSSLEILPRATEKAPSTSRPREPVSGTSHARKPDPGPDGNREPVSLPNGTNIIPPQDSGGLGQLQISNHTDNDAVLKLKTSVGRTTVRVVYVRKNGDVTVSRILPGDYVVQFATGQDWDASRRAFLRSRGFATFDKMFFFSEEIVSDGTVYSEHQITLHAVPNGNMRKLAISAEEFSNDDGVRKKAH
jgi:hypothetical protein